LTPGGIHACGPIAPIKPSELHLHRTQGGSPRIDRYPICNLTKAIEH
jgi:hypothetical protein